MCGALAIALRFAEREPHTRLIYKTGKSNIEPPVSPAQVAPQPALLHQFGEPHVQRSAAALCRIPVDVSRRVHRSNFELAVASALTTDLTSRKIIDIRFLRSTEWTIEVFIWPSSIENSWMSWKRMFVCRSARCLSAIQPSANQPIKKSSHLLEMMFKIDLNLALFFASKAQTRPRSAVQCEKQTNFDVWEKSPCCPFFADAQARFPCQIFEITFGIWNGCGLN